MRKRVIWIQWVKIWCMTMMSIPSLRIAMNVPIVAGNFALETGCFVISARTVSIPGSSIASERGLIRVVKPSARKSSATSPISWRMCGLLARTPRRLV